MNWLILIGTLLGTVIGTAGTILSQHLASRATERRERMTRAAQYREERRQAIESVLEVGQEIERIISDETDRPSEVMHRLWFLRSRLALIASDQLQEPLNGFADALNTTFWNGTPNGEPIWQYLQGPRNRFSAAARSELAAFDTEGS